MTATDRQRDGGVISLTEFVLELERRMIECPRSDLAPLQPLSTAVLQIIDGQSEIPSQLFPRLHQLGERLFPSFSFSLFAL